MQLVQTYGVHMRNTVPAERDTWATLVRSHREAAGMSKVELSRRLGVDRATILRWESGTSRPEHGEVVQRLASLFQIDLDGALASAGLRPETGHLAPLPAPLDPDVARLVQLFEDPHTSAATKEQIRTTMRALLELAEAQPRPPRRKAAG